jgi:hypothetical protein
MTPYCIQAGETTILQLIYLTFSAHLLDLLERDGRSLAWVFDTQFSDHTDKLFTLYLHLGSTQL